LIDETNIHRFRSQNIHPGAIGQSPLVGAKAPPVITRPGERPFPAFSLKNQTIT
jgi:hypothetical protein